MAEVKKAVFCARVVRKPLLRLPADLRSLRRLGRKAAPQAIRPSASSVTELGSGTGVTVPPWPAANDAPLIRRVCWPPRGVVKVRLARGANAMPSVPPRIVISWRSELLESRRGRRDLTGILHPSRRRKTQTLDRLSQNPCPEKNASLNLSAPRSPNTNRMKSCRPFPSGRAIFSLVSN